VLSFSGSTFNTLGKGKDLRKEKIRERGPGGDWKQSTYLRGTISQTDSRVLKPGACKKITKPGREVDTKV